MDSNCPRDCRDKKRTRFFSHQFLANSFHERIQHIIGESRNIAQSRLFRLVSEGLFENAPKHCQLHEHEHDLEGFGSCRFPANIVRSATSCEEERTLLDSICYPGAIILALLKIDFARHGPREERFAD